MGNDTSIVKEIQFTPRNIKIAQELKKLSPESPLISLRVFASKYNIKVNVNTHQKRTKYDIYNDLVTELNKM